MRFVRPISIAAFVLISYAAALAAGTATSSWDDAAATSISAGQTSRSTFMISASVALPSDCYAAGIYHQTPVDPKSPGYWVKQHLAETGICKPMVYDCVITRSFVGDAPKFVIVEYKDNKTNTKTLEKVTVGATRPPHSKTTCLHAGVPS